MEPPKLCSIILKGEFNDARDPLFFMEMLLGEAEDVTLQQYIDSKHPYKTSEVLRHIKEIQNIGFSQYFRGNADIAEMKAEQLQDNKRNVQSRVPDALKNIGFLLEY